MCKVRSQADLSFFTQCALRADSAVPAGVDPLLRAMCVGGIQGVRDKSGLDVWLQRQNSE